MNSSPASCHSPASTKNSEPVAETPTRVKNVSRYFLPRMTSLMVPTIGASTATSTRLMAMMTAQ